MTGYKFQIGNFYSSSTKNDYASGNDLLLIMNQYRQFLTVKSNDPPCTDEVGFKQTVSFLYCLIRFSMESKRSSIGANRASISSRSAAQTQDLQDDEVL